MVHASWCVTVAGDDDVMRAYFWTQPGGFSRGESSHWWPRRHIHISCFSGDTHSHRSSRLFGLHFGTHINTPSSMQPQLAGPTSLLGDTPQDSRCSGFWTKTAGPYAEHALIMTPSTALSLHMHTHAHKQKCSDCMSEGNIHICISIFTSKNGCVYISMYMCYVHIFIHLCTYKCIYVYINTYVCIHIYVPLYKNS